MENNCTHTIRMKAKNNTDKYRMKHAFKLTCIQAIIYVQIGSLQIIPFI